MGARSRPRGEVFSWTVVHRSQTPGFETETPYAVVLVELERRQGRSHDRQSGELRP